MNKWQLPIGWVWKTLSEISEINPRRPRIQREDSELTSFVPMEDVDELEGKFKQIQVKPYEEVRRGYTYFEENDVLYAKITPSMENGKTAIARGLIDNIGFGTTEFHVFRPNTGISPEFLHYYIRRTPFRQEAKEHFRGAVGQQRVPQDFLADYLFPLPFPDEPERSLAEQRRIVARIEALLAEVREMRKLHDEITADANKLMEVTLREVFPHSPHDVQPGWSWVQLSALGKVAGGGTPRKSEKSYWDGTIPWVSPKDMKTDVIMDSQDHVTEEGIENSSAKLIPSKSVLIVFRSGILAHSLPVAIANRELTINQDMKAITPHADFVAEYIAYAMKAREKHFVTTCVKKGPTVHSIVGDRFWQEKVPVPEGADAVIKQQQIVSYLDAIREEVDEVCSLSDSDARLFDSLEQAILSQAFQGEL